MSTKTDASEMARSQALLQLASVCKMVDDLQADDEAVAEEARKTIHEDPLSIEVRSSWYSLGAGADERAPEEFKILLCTGGPACQIIGTLCGGEPQSARIEYQGWFTPWTELELTAEQEEKVLIYCQEFYFGD